MPDPKKYVAGSSSLVMGCDSYTSPAELGDNEFLFGQNVAVRGGIVQTRPGSRSLYCPPEGNFQGFKVFTPQNGVAHHVFAVDGKVYVAAAPFTSYRRLWNIQFSVTAKYIAWAVCLKSTDYDISGNLISLANPYSVLVMQDGLTRAAYWDGGNSGHLNPGLPPFPDQTDVIPGFTETPIGLWSVWSGNRLWVSRENQLFASDIGNPLKFTEATYLNEARAFYLSGPCTGMIETPDQQGILVFTETDGTFFQSSIQQRTDWLNTPDFQKVIIPNVGCVAPRSLVTQYGLTWWFGPRGFTNVNAAMRLNLSSRIDYQDNEMFSSKAYLGPDLSGICASFYENYLMCSVPSADVLNRHTWVLDQAPMEGNANAWTGIWTGWRPIEWGRGIVNGSERVFFGSVDYDGRNRVWEAMLPERTDNGCRITCYAQLRDHAAGSLDQKKYDWSKFFISQMYGEVDLNVYVASTKGSYQLQKNYHMVASEGQVFNDVEYSEVGPYLMGNRVQSRIIRTPSGLDDNECNACGVESKQGNLIDYAFSHLLVWSGQMGIRAYQMHMHESPDRDAGDCEEAETAPRTLNAQGCSGLDLLVDGEVFKEYEATAEGTTVTAAGGSVYIRQTASSVISQENAQAMAECRVQQIINQLHLSDIAAGVYDSGSAEMGTNSSFVVVSVPQDVTDADPCTPLYVTTQPEDADVDEGVETTFSVVVNGTNPQYQWQVSTNGGSSWDDISDGATYDGVNEATLTILVTAGSMDGYEYRCVVTNNCDSVESDSATLSVQTPSLAGAAFASDNGTATLCGYSEFTSPSVPPKKYRLKTYSDGFDSTYKAAADCSGLIVGCDDSVFSGTKTYNPATCAIVDTSDWTYRTSAIVPPQASCPAFGSTNHYTPPDTWSGDASLQVVDTPTTSRWITNGACISVGGGNYHSSAGVGALQTLSVEDTETDAIARATPSGSGTAAVSYRETRGAADFTFLWQDSTYGATASNLVASQNYEVTLDILTENYGGGGGVSSQIVYPFTASGATEPISIPIPCAPGKQVTASNPQISLV